MCSSLLASCRSGRMLLAHRIYLGFCRRAVPHGGEGKPGCSMRPCMHDAPLSLPMGQGKQLEQRKCLMLNLSCTRALNAAPRVNSCSRVPLSLHTMASPLHEINSGFLALPPEGVGLVPTYLVILNHSLPKATAKLWKLGGQGPDCVVVGCTDLVNPGSWVHTAQLLSGFALMGAATGCMMHCHPCLGCRRTLRARSGRSSCRRSFSVISIQSDRWEPGWEEECFAVGEEWKDLFSP